MKQGWFARIGKFTGKNIVIAALTVFAPGAVHAALVEVVINGSTAEATGDIMYADGSTYSARIVFDTAYPDQNVGSADAGQFFDFSTSALVSFAVSTPLGSVTYTPAAVTGAILGPQVGQIQQPNGQIVNVVSANSLLANDGFTGSIAALGPLHTIGLTLTSIGMNANFFTDPNVLFSGAGSLSDEGDFIGGFVSISSNTTGNETGLPFVVGEFSIRPVPLPAPVWLLAGGLVAVLRRRG